MQQAISQIVCWKCRRGSGEKFQLFNVKQEKVIKRNDTEEITLVKSEDYICKDCKEEGFLKPDIWNTSRVHIPTKAEIEEINKRMKEYMEQQASAPQDEVIEGEVIEEKPNIPFVDGVAVKEHVNVQIST